MSGLHSPSPRKHDASEPGSPRSILSGEDMDMTDIHDNGLYLEDAPFRLEKIYDYEPGGHHPVHLGDHLGEAGRYRIIHKLGNGGCANVWLCRDTAVGSLTKYLALKILVADASKPDCPELLVKEVRDLKERQSVGTGADYICLPLDEFTINGPNGSHICFVYPVLGPRVSLGVLHDSENPDAVLRKAGFQAVRALSFLHQNGLCHGDFTPSNILHRVSGLDGLSEDEVINILGEPRKNRVLTDSGESLNNPIAPHYLVYPVTWANVETNYISSDIAIIDFGQAFRVSDPPNDLGIPGPYRSPELLLDRFVGMSCDIWALGCTLFAIRTGRTLFNCFEDEDDAYLETMVNLLGKMPEPWWSKTWVSRKSLFKDDVDKQGRAISLRERLERSEEEAGGISTVHPSVADNARSLRDMLEPGVWYMSEDSPVECEHREISEEEKKLLGDLLSKILVLNPEHRISTQEVMEHVWFRL